jgi:hypothetical protein
MKMNVKEAKLQRSKTEILSYKPAPNIVRIKTSRQIKNLIKETIGNETSQAIIRIFDTKSIGLKLFWLICLLGCSSLCFYLMIQTLITYLSFSVYTTTNIVHEVPTLFPKITICNSAVAITEYAFELIKEINHELYPDINIFNTNQNQMRNISFDDISNFAWNIYSIYQTKINSATFSDANRRKLVHSFEDVMVKCVFMGTPCSSSDFIWQWDSKYGNCYVFNSGFNATSGASMRYKESTLPGIDYGLQLVVYVGYYEKLNPFNTGFYSWMPFTNVYGLYTFIENNTYLSYNKANLISVEGGTINFVSMQRRFTSKLPQPYSDCEIDNSNPGHFDSPFYNLILKSPYQYKQEFCFIQCIQQKSIQFCNCSMSIYLDLYNVSCQNEKESLCALGLLFNGKISSFLSDCVTQCPLECNSTEISFTLTSQRSSGNGYVYLTEKSKVLSSDFNATPITEATTKNKFVQLYMYYDSLSFITSEDTPAMDIVAFLANVGGTLGLFLGISVLSLFEIIHVLVESCILVKDRLKLAKK